MIVLNRDSFNRKVSEVALVAKAKGLIWLWGSAAW